MQHENAFFPLPWFTVYLFFPQALTSFLEAMLEHDPNGILKA
ncbi:MAG: hypothetical protein ABSF91_01955 [Bacteroidota bacterium]|jgi:hypothetical protein